ncbi:3dea75eb-59de-4ff4-b1ea-b1fe9b8712d9 [Sclerotinia trifoliorum]|uniref:3dea75eb-59de-4ff4-b1ea-b1fe9b8712d9 n=1 Tax=Sclerotinia trifoliorum TaxID=28548 RepID=A0A8H2ZQK0_9HELO|nr:3dea75eb-59de-4ff4-b1ea-b1fe9b8712d9 [Sclerotinia trifoliorum]
MALFTSCVLFNFPKIKNLLCNEKVLVMESKNTVDGAGDTALLEYNSTSAVDKKKDEELASWNGKTLEASAQSLISSTIQTRATIQNLPPEIILKLFKILRLDYWILSNLIADHPLHDGFTTSICLALTCRKYWKIFAELWCDFGTTRMPALTRNQASKIQPILASWVPPTFRKTYDLINCHPVPMFLCIDIYGDGTYRSEAERRLLARHDDRFAITNVYYLIECQSGSSPTSRHHVEFPSPQGMGEEWYLTAATIYRDLVWKWYSKCCDYDADIIGSTRGHIELSWVDFRGTDLYQWTYEWDAPEPWRLSGIVEEESEISQRMLFGEVDLLYSEEDIKADLRGFDMIMKAWSLET